MPYFSGPKNVACTPSATRISSNAGMLGCHKANPQASISASSASFMMRISRALSKRSASWPAVAENSA